MQQAARLDAEREIIDLKQKVARLETAQRDNEDQAERLAEAESTIKSLQRQHAAEIEQLHIDGAHLMLSEAISPKYRGDLEFGAAETPKLMALEEAADFHLKPCS